jgi:hypothetical protein
VSTTSAQPAAARPAGAPTNHKNSDDRYIRRLVSILKPSNYRGLPQILPQLPNLRAKRVYFSSGNLPHKPVHSTAEQQIPGS